MKAIIRVTWKNMEESGKVCKSFIIFAAKGLSDSLNTKHGSF